jgi:putative ABC transport system permease protein
MKLSIILSVFLRDFRKQKKRIALTLLALGWGTVSIMLLLGFGEGLQNQMNLNRKGMGENITVLWGGSTSIAYKGMGKGRRIKFLPEDVEYLRKRVPEIDLIGGEYSRWGVKLSYQDKVFTNHIVGVTPEYKYMRNMIPQFGGRMINELDIKNKRRVAFIGASLKFKLYGDEEAVGKTVMVNSMPFTVVGVMI